MWAARDLDHHRAVYLLDQRCAAQVREVRCECKLWTVTSVWWRRAGSHYHRICLMDAGVSLLKVWQNKAVGVCMKTYIPDSAEGKRQAFQCCAFGRRDNISTA